MTGQHPQRMDHPPIAMKTLDDSELDSASAGTHWVTGPDGKTGWDTNDDGIPDVFPN